MRVILMLLMVKVCCSTHVSGTVMPKIRPQHILKPDEGESLVHMNVTRVSFNGAKGWSMVLTQWVLRDVL